MAKRKSNNNYERIIWELSDNEITQLKSITIGFGNLKKAAEKAGIKRKTLERIVLAGSGYKKNISLIRENLLQAEPVEN